MERTVLEFANNLIKTEFTKKMRYHGKKFSYCDCFRIETTATYIE